jgi:hypothetical protein
MENKSHWVYDYIHKAETKHHKVENIVIKEQPEVKPRHSKPDQEYSKSVKNDIFAKKKHVTFDQARSYALEAESSFAKPLKSINLENKKKDNLQKSLEAEFNTIDNTLDEIRKLSQKIISSNPAELDEIRANVFDQISNIDNRTFNLRDLLSKTY